MSDETDYYESLQRGVIGAALTYPEDIGGVVGRLRPAHFTGDYVKLWRSIAAMHGKGEPINEATLAAEARVSQALVNKIEAYGVLSDAADGLIKAYADRRRFDIAKDTARRLSSATHDTAGALLADAKRRIEENVGETAAQPTDLGKLTAASRLPALMVHVERGIRREPTGVKLLDEKLQGGLVRPSIAVLGAEPKIGKSIFASCIAENIAERGGYVVYIDLENGSERFFRRLLCRNAKVSPTALHGDMSLDESRQWKAAAERWQGDTGKRFVYYDKRSKPGEVMQLIAEARSQAGDRPLLVVIDSLQKLQIEDMSQRRGGIDQWLRLLEEATNAHDAIVFVVSELKRPDRDGRYKAGLTSFKESGDIEYTAHLALTMTRENDDEPVKLVVACDRDGDGGDVGYYETVKPHYGMSLRPEARPQRKGTAAPYPGCSDARKGGNGDPRFIGNVP